jgi:diacylglycerol kinase (ATP)
LKKNTRAKFLFVVNLKSGIGSAKDIQSQLEEAAQKYHFEWMIYETTGENDKKGLQQLFKKYKPEVVFAVGGDGTVNLVATELIGSKIKMGIIPAGSANGLAYNLGIKDNLDQIFTDMEQEKPLLMDGIKVNKDHFCYHLGDIGLNARIVSRFEKEGSKGMLGYGKQLLKELFNKKTWFTFYLQIPGERRKKMRAEMVVIANATSYGTGAMINPIGKLDDGKFELVIIRPYPWWFIFTFIYAAFTGKVHRMRYIKVLSASEAMITLTKPQEFQLDGEVIPQTKQIKAEIVRGAVKVVGYHSG